MSMSLRKAPWVSLETKELISNQGPALLAQQAQACGPVLRWTIPIGKLAGREAVFLVGPEANRFVMHTHREYFSHEQGWTPVIGHLMGKGLLNMDLLSIRSTARCGILPLLTPIWNATCH